MTKQTDVYAPLLKGWQAKVLGDKPVDEALQVAHAFGRPGKQSLALALAMRAEGVSGAQIVMVCGAPQNNHRRGLIAAGMFKRDMSVPANSQGHTVYKVTLTPKGEAALKRRSEANAKAALTGDVPVVKAKAVKAKAKVASKPRKALVTVDQPVAELIDVGQVAPVSEAPADQHIS